MRRLWAKKTTIKFWNVEFKRTREQGSKITSRSLELRFPVFTWSKSCLDITDLSFIVSVPREAEEAVPGSLRDLKEVIRGCCDCILLTWILVRDAVEEMLYKSVKLVLSHFYFQKASKKSVKFPKTKSTLTCSSPCLTWSMERRGIVAKSWCHPGRHTPGRGSPCRWASCPCQTSAWQSWCC